MHTTISYRNFQSKDFSAVADIIRNTWHYNQLCSSACAKRLSYLYLSSCLCNQTFHRVAVWEETPIGIILCHDRSIFHFPIIHRLRQLYHMIALLMKKEGRALIRTFACVNDMDQIMLRRQKKYPGEIAFFALAEQARGKGIGAHLFQDAMQYFQQKQIASFFLFTDSSCNYGFYEHMGLQRKDEIHQQFFLSQHDVTMEFYLYEGHLSISKKAED